MAFRLATLLAVALITSACESTTTAPAPEPARLATLTIASPGLVSDGDVKQLVSTARDQVGAVLTNATITWSSTNPTVATISTSGLLTALREGNTEVVAIARLGESSVEQRMLIPIALHPAMLIELNREALELPIGTNATTAALVRGVDGRILQNRPVTFISDNPAVADITAGGVIRALNAGTARIIAQYGTLRDTLIVTVPTPVPTSTRYRVTSVNGSPTMPAIIDDDVVRGPDGQDRRYLTRIDSVTITTGITYSVVVYQSVSERSELQGNVIERLVGRTTIRDEGTVSYDWFTGDAELRSTKVGGLQHLLSLRGPALVLSFREPGSLIPWVFTLAPRTTP